MAGDSEAEIAVRNYLLYLEDPNQLVDQAEVQRLETATRSASDPLERLHAINSLHLVRNGEPDTHRKAFIAHAKTWANANDIRPASFLQMGVDEATLRSAGFPARELAGHATRSRRAPRASARRGQVRVDQVKDAARGMTGDFTLADVSAASGGSPMTIRKAVEELVAAGELERLGPTPNWSQPGRAPIQFRTVKKRTGRP